MDEIVDHYPGRCGGCGRQFDGEQRRPAGRFGRRQIAELPPISVIWTEHRTHQLRCRHYRARTSAIEPPPESLISGAQVWMPRRVAVTLISKIRFQASMSTSGRITRSLDPTMFMSTCSPPAWSFTWATAASQWS
ncbi:MAG: IS66 family transposase zinc-finger binding domain-containing protein [Solirubrobacterales bacterium]|nr:IS66 family transposase zinc-finger binding domain-containing protein [Solirubrobacterales bacterium]